ncbi:ribose-phosphate diphosphokinase [Infirmifilum lucidum]|uniref:ribose-phosphate diphosphokinase n=1 Tax=Infirmifilum lucidum TaxID=2776706 RepID=A0A7L9FET9_9CREN|nr:ribose-phosphate diphosphokinase [Infirmifilum lucidum]QOJ78249.1 ribose-phosphate diphosphokinase [Infirmifilum lucidum]
MTRQDILILPGQGCAHLGLEVSRILGVPLAPLTSREFPDKEIYVKVPVEVAGKVAVLMVCPGRRPNDALIEALLAARTISRLGAKEIVLVVPYMPYARQDEEFNPGEAVSIKIVSEFLESLGISALVTVDMHLHRFKEVSDVFRVRAFNATVMGELARFVRENYGHDYVVVAPDVEARQWAEAFSRVLNAEYIVLEKERRGDENVEIKGVSGAIRGAVIVDDIISTGSTVATTVSLLRRNSVEEVLVACTHGLFVSGAESKILSAGARDIVTSNTVVNPFARVSAAPPIARALSEIIRE